MDYDLLHFTIYACICALAGLVYTCAIYLICLSHSHVSYGPRCPLMIFLHLRIYEYVGYICICGTKRAKRLPAARDVISPPLLQLVPLSCLLNSQLIVAKAALSRLSTQSMPLIWPLSNRTQKMYSSSCLTSLATVVSSSQDSPSTT